MSDRKDHIKNLKLLMDFFQNNNVFTLTKEITDSLMVAIQSLEVDEAYQLEYEKAAYITIDELKEIRDEIFKELLHYSGTGEALLQAYCDGLNKSFNILNKKISELEGKK